MRGFWSKTQSRFGRALGPSAARKFAVAFALIWTAAGTGAAGAALWALQDMPKLPSLTDYRRPASVTFKDRYGQDIGTRGSLPSRPANLDLLPDHLPAALLAIEDRRFYRHFGVDVIGTARALAHNYKTGRLEHGGSSLTQQLAKNLFLTPERTLKRKAQEALIALALEQRFTKREILELYLGRVYFGAGAYGIDAAAERYFAKPAADLSLGESAMLAGLLKAPSSLAPTQSGAAASARTTLVLDAMARYGFATPEHRDGAFATPIVVEPPAPLGSENFYMDYAWTELTTLIGLPEEDMTVHTAMDVRAQRAADKAIAAHLSQKRGASEAALISMDATGGVRVMVGGADYSQSQFNRAVLARRQPGSAFKPFVYLAALRAGISPSDVRVDAPILLGDWSPANYKPEFLGEVSVADALAKSLNTVAVQLGEEAGRDAVVALAADMGLPDLLALRSLALGAQEVSPLALTQSYIPFAAYGYDAQAYAIMAIDSQAGRPLFRRARRSPVKKLAPQELRDMNMMMLGTVEHGTGTRAKIKGREIAGKTGTTNDYRDAWFVGYVPDLVTSVWVGNDAYTAMNRVTGGTIPADIWHDFMVLALEGTPVIALPKSVPALAPDWPVVQSEALP